MAIKRIPFENNRKMRVFFREKKSETFENKRFTFEDKRETFENKRKTFSNKREITRIKLSQINAEVFV